MTPPPDPLAEIKRLYYATTRATVLRDFERAIDLLKAVPTEDERERAAVYMDGLAQMRSEWGVKSAAPGGTARKRPKPNRSPT